MQDLRSATDLFWLLRLLLSYFWEFDAMFGNRVAVRQGGSQFQCVCVCVHATIYVHVSCNSVQPEMIVSLQHPGCEGSLSLSHAHSLTHTNTSVLVSVSHALFSLLTLLMSFGSGLTGGGGL